MLAAGVEGGDGRVSRVTPRWREVPIDPVDTPCGSFAFSSWSPHPAKPGVNAPAARGRVIPGPESNN